MDPVDNTFITPGVYAARHGVEAAFERGWLQFVACNSGAEFGLRVKASYEEKMHAAGHVDYSIPFGGGLIPYDDKNPTPDMQLTTVFDDTESRPRLPDNVAGSDAFVFQDCLDRNSSYTVGHNFWELLQTIRCLKENRARTITAVIRYHPFARQEKNTFGRREPVTASLVGDAIAMAGADNVLTYHLHTDTIKGMYPPSVSVVALSGLDFFLGTFDELRKRSDVIALSVDEGGGKPIRRFASAMELDYLIPMKDRHHDQEATTDPLARSLEGMTEAIITDDETVTMGSIVGILDLLTEYGIKRKHVGLSHLKIGNNVIPRLIEAHEKKGLVKLYATDSVPQTPEVVDLDFVEVCSQADPTAATINRIHTDTSVSEIFHGKQ